MAAPVAEATKEILASRTGKWALGRNQLTFLLENDGKMMGNDWEMTG
jgi:hypothetical protein